MSFPPPTLKTNLSFPILLTELKVSFISLKLDQFAAFVLKNQSFNGDAEGGCTFANSLMGPVVITTIVKVI